MITENMMTLGLVIFLSTSIGLWYTFLGEDWAASKHQQYVSILMSPAVLIITWAISDNLALSLGMIGALSIVRFRNPVKSPAELSIYFIYIVIGVSAGVNYKYAVSIWVVAMVAPLIVSALNMIRPIGNIVRNDMKGLIAHFQADEPINKIFSAVKLDKNRILSVQETVSGGNRKTHISIIVKDQLEFLSIIEDFEKCGNLSSSNLQQSF